MLYRKIETVIEEHIKSDSKKILLIDGARQVGKTYIIRYVGKKIFKNFIEINMVEDSLGNRLFENTKTVEDFYLQVSMLAGNKMGKKSDTLIFIDEIQAYPHLPSMNREMQAGLVNAYLESGYLPEWSSPGHRDCMIGQNSASVVADAYIKGIRVEGQEKLWDAVTYGAHHHLDRSASGRLGHEYYDRLGYVPCNVGIGQNVARTLEYAYNDWCIYTLGRAMGKSEAELAPYKKAAFNYTNVYNPQRQLMCGREEKGAFNSQFVAEDWSGEFCEGNSWHWSFCVFHDPKGLSRLMGGRSQLVQMMDSVFVLPSYLGMRSRGMIHEMREMQVMDMGQYAHGNQPIQHMVYLYDWAGQPWKAQYWTREIMDKLYNSNADAYCGDEDNGQTSAWYVFSAMGFYPVCPGTKQYAIGSPLFQSVKVKLENGKSIVLQAPGNNKDTRYVNDVKINGKSVSRTWLSHDELTAGARIQFQMSSKPNMKRGTAEKDAPYSFSSEETK